MPSYYSIAQYVPDAGRNERINIGIFCFGSGETHSCFLDNWSRIRNFAGKDVSFLKEFARDAKHFDEESIRRVVDSWKGTIQLTPPAASLLSPDNLLINVVPVYLIQNGPANRGYRVKSDVVKLVTRRVREKLLERLGPVGRSYLKDQGYMLRGTHKGYQCDVSVGNGHPIFAGQCLSFQIPDSKSLEKEISAAAWITQEIKTVDQDFPLGIVALPPKTNTTVYNDAKKIFEDLGVEWVPETELQSWVERMVEKVPQPQSLR